MSNLLQNIWKSKLIYDIKRKGANPEILNKFDLYERINIFSSLNKDKQTISLFQMFFQKEIDENKDIDENAVLLSLSFKVENFLLPSSIFKNFYSSKLIELCHFKKAINKFKHYESLHSESDFIDALYSGFSLNSMPFTDFGNNRREDNVYILIYNNFIKNKNNNFQLPYIIKEQGFKNFLLCLTHINLFYYLEQYKKPKDSFLDILNSSKEITLKIFPENNKSIIDYFDNSFFVDFINQSLCHSIFPFEEKFKIKTNEEKNVKNQNEKFLWLHSEELKRHTISFGTTGQGKSYFFDSNINFVLNIFNSLYSLNKENKYFNIDNNQIFQDIWDVSFFFYNENGKRHNRDQDLSEFINNIPKNISIFNHLERDNILSKISKDDVKIIHSIIERAAYSEKETLQKILTNIPENEYTKPKRRM